MQSYFAQFNTTLCFVRAGHKTYFQTIKDFDGTELSRIKTIIFSSFLIRPLQLSEEAEGYSNVELEIV
ncbi:MAG: hypothetical protein K0R08_2240 [Solimicrobium sp.]|jgi:hypothetical protein|nr:hypothetical protein [Solimicrobium sp.]